MPNTEFEKQVYREAAEAEYRKQSQRQQVEDRAYRQQLDKMNLERAERAEQLTREALAETRCAYRQNRLLIVITACIGFCTVLIEFLSNFNTIVAVISQWLK